MGGEAEGDVEVVFLCEAGGGGAREGVVCLVRVSGGGGAGDVGAGYGPGTGGWRHGMCGFGIWGSGIL